MPSFLIKDYTLNIARNSSTQFRVIGLSSPVMTHGIVNRATLYFFPSYTTLNGSVQNVGGLNYNGIHVVGMIPVADFEMMYRVIQTEAPVTLVYQHGTSSTTTKPLTYVAIITGPEVPGEGPIDADAVAG